MSDSARELSDWLKAAPFEMKRGLASKIRQQAERLAAGMKAAAPVKSGALRESIKVRRTRDSLKFHVTAGGETTTADVREGSGVPYDYVRAVEFGTTKTPAHPFFYSTARAMESDIHNEIKSAVAHHIAIRRTVYK